MHREFRKRLGNAKGVSEFPIVANVDIRGFSTWSLQVDSAQTGLFIKRVYAKLLDRYLAEARYFKPTGDGLLVILPVDEDRPKAGVRKAVTQALKIVADFPGLTKGDSAVNFPVPQEIGIGLARGPASRLVSGNKTLDYSGRTLNLASRLMDLARPQGVVLDGAFGTELLTPSVRRLFTDEHVYLKGIAPRKGLPIFYTSEYTNIPASAKQPLDEVKWGEGTWETKLRELKAIKIANFEMPLDAIPVDPSTIKVRVRHDAFGPTGKRLAKQWMGIDLTPSDYSYDATGGKPTIEIALGAVRKYLEDVHINEAWPVTITAVFEAA